MTLPNSSARPTSRLSRRNFLQNSLLAAGATVLAAPQVLRAASPDSPVRAALIGVGGQGTERLKEALACGAKVIAVCDVDDHMLATAATRVSAQQAAPTMYTDYRKLLEREKDLEAVIIATPDHWHARVSRDAMRAGKHVFCEKPLTHTVAEARAIRELARRSKVVTQMGNQGSATKTLRRGVEVISAGAIGTVREVFVWVAKSGSFKPGQAAPEGSDPVPADLHWDNWIGPAPFHPYKKGIYHPRAWRAWYDFGGGSMGDWGCHGLNLPVRALNLGYPTAITPDVAENSVVCYPKDVRIRFDFGTRGSLPPATLWWYDGGRLPPVEVIPDGVLDHYGQVPNDGVLVLGDLGFTFGAPHPGSEYIQLHNESKMSGILNHPGTRDIAATLPRSPGHMQEWLDACRGNGTPYSNFEVGGMLTEIVLSGVVALRVGKRIEWNGPEMKSPDAPQAEPFIQTVPRAGWA